MLDLKFVMAELTRYVGLSRVAVVWLRCSSSFDGSNHNN